METGKDYVLTYKFKRRNKNKLYLGGHSTYYKTTKFLIDNQEKTWYEAGDWV
jgi:hypothetical protein